MVSLGRSDTTASVRSSGAVPHPERSALSTMISSTSVPRRDTAAELRIGMEPTKCQYHRSILPTSRYEKVSAYAMPKLKLLSRSPEGPHSRKSDELAPLVPAVLRGHGPSVQTFLASVGTPMLRVVRRILGVAHPEVEDTLQESLIAVMDALPNFRGESTVLHFACRVAVLTAMNARRRQHSQDKYLQQHPPDRLEELARAGSERPAAEGGERRELVLRLLDELPEAQAEVLALHCALGYTVREVAEVCGIPVNTVRGRLVTAKQALRAKLHSDSQLRELTGGAS